MHLQAAAQTAGLVYPQGLPLTHSGRSEIMTKRSSATWILLLVASGSSASAGDETYAHLPKFELVRTYFNTHRAPLNVLFDQYAEDDRINWVECDGDGVREVTSFSDNADFESSPAQHQIFQEICLALNIGLVQRVDHGVSLIWKDVKTEHRKFRIELYGSDMSYEDTCLDHQFDSPISSCMVPLDARWHARYIGILNPES